MKRTTLIILAMTLATGQALAEDEHRELGAHVHGHGVLNIAIEKSRVSIELEVPGMDIVGFEHGAESAEQRSAVATATKLLGEPLTLFRLPVPAGCTVADTKVAVETEHEDAGHADEGSHEGAEHAGEEHDEDGGHNEFHATYALECASPAALTSITFDYFKSFAGARDLTVNVVTSKAQSTFEVSRDKPMLDLVGIM